MPRLSQPSCPLSTAPIKAKSESHSRRLMGQLVKKMSQFYEIL